MIHNYQILEVFFLNTGGVNICVKCDLKNLACKDHIYYDTQIK